MTEGGKMKKLRWLKDCKYGKKGEIGNAGEKSAENFVSQGYAEYIEETSNNKGKHKQTQGYRTDLVSDVDTKLESESGKTRKEISETLKEEAKLQKIEDMKLNEINWLEGDFWNNWDMVKGHMKKLMRHHEDFSGEQDLFFLAHSKDKIKGKPQLVEPVMRKFPLVRLCIKKVKDKNAEEGEKEIQKIFTFDEKFDKRYDGYQAEVLSLDFWLYRVVDNGREYYVYSDKELSQEVQEMHGMIIPVDDFAELSRSLRLKSISNIFILKESIPAVQSIPKEELINFTKALSKIGSSPEAFKDYLFYHKEDNRIYDYPEIYNKLKIAQLLSGKYEGYPLQMIKVGPAGTGKTCEQEINDQLFQEEQGILEGADSRPKSLEPSFKEKPANIGYIAKCNRFAMIDELFKMVENDIKVSNDANAYSGHLGSLNFLLEQKKRSVGSGNNNSVVIKSTAKIFVTTNPMQKRLRIANHVGVIDPTTLSRFFIWVQDEAEQEKAYKKEWKVPRTPKQDYPKQKSFSANTITSIYDNCYMVKKIENKYSLEKVYAEKDKEKYTEIKPFLTIYDSCQEFLSNIEEQKVRKIIEGVTARITGQMLSVWRPRALHHSVLILDGLVKFRCLFKDFDSTFQAKQEDYDDLERILHHMVNSWDTKLLPEVE